MSLLKLSAKSPSQPPPPLEGGVWLRPYTTYPFGPAWLDSFLTILFLTFKIIRKR